MLRKTEEVDRSIEQTRLELGFEVNWATPNNTNLSITLDRNKNDYPRLKFVRQSRDIDQGGDVNGELDQDREKHVEVEDISKGPLARELLYRLCGGQLERV